MLPATPETTPAPLSPEQETAAQQITAMLADRADPFHDLSHPRHPARVQHFYALHAAQLEPGQNRTLVSFRESEDKAGPLPPVEGPAPLVFAEPVLVGGASWDPALVGPLDAALAGAGLPPGEGHALRTILAEEQNAGTLGRWTPATALAEMERKYGPTVADAYIADAEQSEAVLPAAVKAWLRSSGAHCHPRVIVAAAELWRRKTNGAG